jgi:hypothetical protein
MMNGHDLTNFSQVREEQGNLKGGHVFDLGNGREEIAKVARSFKGGILTHYPYPFALPYLTARQEAGAHDPLSYLQADISQYADPTKRQAQNLDRTPAKQSVGLGISTPVIIGMAVVAVALFTVSLHLTGTINLGR